MNQIKQGYKQTKVGIIPEDWEVVKLGELSNKIGSGITPTGGETVYQSSGRFFIRSQNVGLGSLLLDDVAYISDEIHSTFKNTEIKQNDVLLNITGASIGRCAIANKTIEGGNVNQHVCIIRLKINKIDTKFLTTFLLSHQGQKQIDSFQAGGNRQGLNFAQIASFITPLPPLKEQEKIAEILTIWDEVITKQTELLRAKELQKKGLMQKLLSGEVRFGGFTDEWEDIRLEEIIKEISLKTTISNQYEVLSVTKNGIYSQQEHFNKQIASEDNTGYKIVKYGNLVFSTMNLWMGSLDIVRNYDIGIVSPAYKVFEINYEKYDIDFIQHYLKSHHMIWLYNMNSEQGASIVRRNLDLNSLLTTKVKIPSFDEQSKIGEVLSLADDEINLLKNELEELKLQKKALMQKLLTGEVRVKV